MNLQSQLTAARDSLTPENWSKGRFFKLKLDYQATRIQAICMCAHGAVQAVVNPACKSSLDTDAAPSDKVNSAHRAAVVNTLVGRQLPSKAADEASYDVRFANNKSLQSIWDQRPGNVKEDVICNNQNYGNQDAHYLMGMVGLTATFNDDPHTTFEMLIAKFDEAIALAKQLNV